MATRAINRAGRCWGVRLGVGVVRSVVYVTSAGARAKPRRCASLCRVGAQRHRGRHFAPGSARHSVEHASLRRMGAVPSEGRHFTWMCATSPVVHAVSLGMHVTPQRCPLRRADARGHRDCWRCALEVRTNPSGRVCRSSRMHSVALFVSSCRTCKSDLSFRHTSPFPTRSWRSLR